MNKKRLKQFYEECYELYENRMYHTAFNILQNPENAFTIYKIGINKIDI